MRDGSGSGAGLAPVVPGRLPLLGHTLSLLSRPFGFLSSLRAHGALVRIYLGRLPVYVVTRPELAWQVLATDAERFERGMVFDKIRPLFGNGLLNSDGELHRRQRRLVAPAFHRAQITGYVQTMARVAAERVGSWRPGDLLAVDAWMADLALTIVGRALFSSELGPDAIAEIQRSMPVLAKYVVVRALSPTWVERLPLPANRRFDEATARFHRVVARVIAAARAQGTDHAGLLSMLLQARDEDTGEGMSNEQVHDEVITILTAGAETTAMALAWLFHELGAHPEIEDRFHTEIDHILAGRPASEMSWEDIPRLAYTERIITEVLRKYPLPILMRRARSEVELGGVRIQAGSEVALSQYAIHHDSGYYPDPARFAPDRWLPERAARLPNGAFIPFGAGLHHCPGYAFARTEIAIVAVTLAAQWRLVPVAGKPVRPTLTTTMRPNQLPMMAVPRHA